MINIQKSISNFNSGLINLFLLDHLQHLILLAFLLDQGLPYLLLRLLVDPLDEHRVPSNHRHMLLPELLDGCIGAACHLAVR
jgi:hypothetical protein